MPSEPFTIHVPDAVLDDLRRRLAATRWPDQVDGAGWAQGTELEFLRDLCEHWRDGFDWRAQERRLNAFPQLRVPVGGLMIHCLHVPGRGPDPLPLILTHGWPSSFAEFSRLLPRLTDPAAHGGSAEDAFTVVVPSMPGYGFSERPREPFTSARTADLWPELMRALGHARFAAHGGDIGGGVTARLAQRHPDAVIGIHVTNVYGWIGPDDPPATPAERAHLEHEARWEREHGAYAEVHAAMPQTVAYALNDSPAGLAAWIVDRQREWSDGGGDLLRAIDRDDVLTNLTVYWATQTIGSSLRPYWDSRHDPDPPPWGYARVPTAVALFPKDLAAPPREFAERSYDVRRWTEMPRGGHFPALEQPEALADDLRAFFRELRL